MDPFAEHLDLAAELRGAYEASDDAARAAAAAARARDVRALISSREADVKAAVEALSKSVDAAAAAAAPPPSAASHTDRMEAGRAALTETRENVASLRADAARLRKAADAAATDGSALAAAVAKAKADAAAAAPRLAHALSLYTHITRLHVSAGALPARFVATHDGGDRGLTPVDVALDGDPMGVTEAVWRVINGRE